MKKLLIATNIILLGVVGYQAYKANWYRPEVPEPGSIKEVFDNSDIPLTDNLDGLINDSLAWAMSDAFKNNVNKSRISINNLIVDDTRSILFNLATLKSFISTIDTTMPRGERRPKLGIRVYFGVYPAEQDLNKYRSLDNFNSSIALRQSVFFVACYRKEGTIDEYIDYNFNYPGSDPYQPIPYWKLKDSFPGFKPAILGGGANMRDFLIRTPDGGWQILSGEGIQNHGGMAPPPAGTGSFPTPAN